MPGGEGRVGEAGARRSCLTARRLWAGHTQESLAEALAVDPSTVRRWELGVSTPRPRLRGPLAEVLVVDLAALDRLLDCRHVGVHGHRTTGSNSGTSGFDQAAPTGPATWVDVEVVRAVTATFAGLENRVGGVPVVDRGLGHLRWATGLLDRGARPGVRADLFEAVGNLAEVVGFCALDVNDATQAERCFRAALDCADSAGSWVLRAAVLADLARVHANAGEARAALSAIEVAQRESDRLPPTARAMLHVMRARYLVLDRRPAGAFRQVELADEEIACRDPSGDPPWMQYYDLAEHHGSVGRALAPLAVASARPDLAVSRLEAAIRLQADGYPRSRVFSRIRLARLLVATGEPHRAVAAAGPAILDGAALTSGRVLDEFDQLLCVARQTDALALRSLSSDIADHIASQQGALPMTTDNP